MRKTEFIISIKHKFTGTVQMLAGHCAASETATCLFTYDPDLAIKSRHKYNLLVWQSLLKSHMEKTGERFRAVIHPIHDAPIWD